MGKINVAFLHNALKEYRRAFFISLSRIFTIDFTFLESVKEEELNIISIDKLWKRNYSLLISGIYTEYKYNFKVLATLIIFKLRKKPVIGWSEFWHWPRISLPDRIRYVLYYVYFFIILKFLDALIVPLWKSY